MIVENWNDYLAAKQLMRFLLNLNHDLRQTANRVVSWHVDFLFGFFPPKRVDGLALVGQSSVKVQNKSNTLSIRNRNDSNVSFLSIFK